MVEYKDPIPVPVLAVVSFGIATSAFLLGIRPLNTTPGGVWDTPAADVARSNFCSEGALLLVRLAIFAWSLGIGIAQVWHRGVWVMAYYTMWSWTVLVAYFGVAALASWRVLRRKQATQPAVLDALGFSQIALLHVLTPAVVIVDVLTWVVLVPMLTAPSVPPERAAWARRMFYNFLSYNTHGANAVFVALEVILNCVPFTPYLGGFLGAYTAAFGLWAFAFFRWTGRWLYPFLDASQPYAALVYAGIYVACWAAMAAGGGLFVARDAAARRLQAAVAQRRAKAE